MMKINSTRIWSRPAAGFTFVEFLVLLAIILILIGMLMPATRTVRESARRTECANRLRQIAVATHNYTDTHHYLPPGQLCQTGATTILDYFSPSSGSQFALHNQGTSAIGLILPFLELKSLSSKWDPIIFDVDQSFWNYTSSDGTGEPGADGRPKVIEDYVNGWAFSKDQRLADSYWEVVYHEPPQLACPSDDINETYTIALFMNTPLFDPKNDKYDGMTGLGWHWQTGNGGWDEIGRTNYAACGGACSGGLNRTGELLPYVGCMGPREKRWLDSIPDGTSNVVMFGETLGDNVINSSTGATNRNWTTMNFGAGICRGRGAVPWMKQPALSNQPTPKFPNGNDPRGTILGNTKMSQWTGFAAAHPTGVNFTFANGTVHFVPRTTPWEILYALYGENDGSKDLKLDF